MKIAQVITRMNVGGAQESVVLTCRGHLDAGHEVTLITGPSEGPEGKMFEKMPKPNGLKIIDVPYLIREISPWNDFLAYRQLSRIFKENEFDVVHTNSSKAGILARIAAYRAGVKVVVHTVHGQAFHRYQGLLKNKLYIWLERLSARYCHQIYAVAQAMIEQCVTENVAPREKYKLVYTGMDLTPYLESKADPRLREQLGIPKEAIVIGTIARLFPLKGYEQLMPVALQLVERNPKVHFLFLGDGTLRAGFEHDIGALGLSKNFHFTGMIDVDAVPAHAALFTFMAHLSLREGLPRGVVQALAAGKPCVAFNLDGTPEVVLHEKTGLILEPNCAPEKILDAFEKLIKDPILCGQLGAAGRDRVKRDFQWQYMADTLLESYKKLLKKVKN